MFDAISRAEHDLSFTFSTTTLCYDWRKEVGYGKYNKLVITWPTCRGDGGYTCRFFGIEMMFGSARGMVRIFNV